MNELALVKDPPCYPDRRIARRGVQIPADETGDEDAPARAMGLSALVGRRIYRERGGAKPGEFVTIAADGLVAKIIARPERIPPTLGSCLVPPVAK